MGGLRIRQYASARDQELGTWNWELSLTKIWALNESRITLNEYTNNEYTLNAKNKRRKQECESYSSMMI